VPAMVRGRQPTVRPKMQVPQSNVSKRARGHTPREGGRGSLWRLRRGPSCRGCQQEPGGEGGGCAHPFSGLFGGALGGLKGICTSCRPRTICLVPTKEWFLVVVVPKLSYVGHQAEAKFSQIFPNKWAKSGASHYGI